MTPAQVTVALLAGFALGSFAWIFLQAAVARRLQAVLRAEATGRPALSLRGLLTLNVVGATVGIVAGGCALLLPGLAHDLDLVRTWGDTWRTLGGVVAVAAFGLAVVWHWLLGSIARRRSRD